MRNLLIEVPLFKKVELLEHFIPQTASKIPDVSNY